MKSSVFTPSSPRCYRIIHSHWKSNTEENSSNESVSSEEKKTSTVIQNSKQWNDEIIMYLMLKYRRWQLKGRKEMILNNFLTELSESILKIFRLNKTSSQLKDKINNTKSSYSLIVKKMSEIHHSKSMEWKKEKMYCISQRVFIFMDTYYGVNRSVTLDDIDRKIAEIETKYNNHFTTSSQLKNAILRMKNQDV